VLNVLPLAPLPGSAAAGWVPPTKSVTATALPLVASARQVITGSSALLEPLRADSTLALTTRTW
jgi:hypothetical protein